MVKKLKKKTKKTASPAKKTAKPAAKPALPPSEDEKIKKTKIRVIGLGGGGGNIVSEIVSKISKASFVIANTDSKSLKSCGRKAMKFQFGQNLTRGLGTGMNPVLGQTAAQAEKERIKKILEGQDLCILVVALGGGTGSGAVSTFARISKNLGNLTYGIFTLPFKFEGEKKMEIALNSLKEVKNHLNAMTIIPNERIFQIIDKDTPLKEALSAINKFLAESLGGLIETIYEPGLINIDFADFRTIMEGRGRLAYLNTVKEERKEDNKVRSAASKVLNSPLYPYTIKGAKGVLLNIAGEKNLSLSDVNQISETISDLASSEAKIIFGISQNKKYSNVIKTVLLATGCERLGFKISSPAAKPAKPRKKVRKVKKEKTADKDKKIEKPKVKAKKKIKKPVTKKVKIRTMEKAPERTCLPAGREKPQEAENIKEETPLVGDKVRKNALQIKKEAEELEKEMVEKEKFWETPAFLRKKIN
jgi:cell division protein FtsZ